MPLQLIEGSVSHFWPRTLILNRYTNFRIFSCPVGSSNSTVSRAWIATVVNLWENRAGDSDVLGENGTYSENVNGTYPYAYPSYGFNGYVSTQQAIKMYKKTSEKLMLIDCQDGANKNLNRYVGAHRCSHYNAGVTANQPAIIHQNLANILWMDGHANQKIFPSKSQTAVYATLSIDVWLPQY